MLELKPCPFCGESGDSLMMFCDPDEGRDNSGPSRRIQCAGCNIEAPFYPSKADAIAAWNRRTLSTITPAEVGGLVAELRDEDFRHEMQHLRSSSEIDRLFQAAASLIQSQAARIAELEAECRLSSDDVEWVTNDIAELGVKIRDQFFFLYKGRSLVYGELDPDPTIPPVHDDDTPMHWRPVFKREFGECAHPINYKDPTMIGTVCLSDSDEWKPLPPARSLLTKDRQP